MHPLIDALIESETIEDANLRNLSLPKAADMLVLSIKYQKAYNEFLIYTKNVPESIKSMYSENLKKISDHNKVAHRQILKCRRLSVRRLSEYCGMSPKEIVDLIGDE